MAKEAFALIMMCNQLETYPSLLSTWLAPCTQQGCKEKEVHEHDGL